MATEEEIIIGFVFKRSGKDRLKESEIYLPLSIELGWFSTEEAKNFVTDAIQQNLLIQKEGRVSPSFEYTTIPIPVGFHPSIKSIAPKKTIDKEESETESKNIIQYICENTKKPYDEIIQEVQNIQNDKSITQSVAALYLAQNYHLDISDYLKIVEQSLFTENEE